MKKLSKVALFVYNRPEHALRVLEGLKNNFLSDQSEVYIFSDHPKNFKDHKNVKKVRKIISNFKAFKKKKIIFRNKNFGLAKNFIYGINQMFRKNDKLIVLEDDNLTSPFFLKFMNDSLDLYKHSNNVGAISGYSYNLSTNDNNTFFSTFVPSWGWGTWKRSWRYFEADANKLLNKISNKKIKKKFNLDNSYDWYSMLERCKNKQNQSWSIRWYASLFINKKLTLFNTRSYVQNIGFDGTGAHTPKTKIFNVEYLNEYKKIKKIKIIVNKKYNQKLRNFFYKLAKKEKKQNFYFRIERFIKNLYRILRPDFKS